MGFVPTVLGFSLHQAERKDSDHDLSAPVSWNIIVGTSRFGAIYVSGDH
jgi:hypothetical protein